MAKGDRAEERNKALIMYRSGMKLVDIAGELKVPAGTVRRWKSNDGWDETNVRKKKTERSHKTNEHIHKEAKKSKNGLTEKQEDFCLYYLKYRNFVQAYVRAFDCSYKNACRHASELGKKEEVQKRINELLEEERQALKIDMNMIAQMQLKIATADPSDFVIVDENGLSKLKPMDQIDGSLIKEIKVTKKGPQVVLENKQKAIEWLSKYTSEVAAVNHEGNMTGVAIIPQRREE